MKVDVTIIKRPGVKVDVTLVRGKPRSCRVNLPVRVASVLPPEDDSSLSSIPDELPCEPSVIPVPEESDGTEPTDSICDTDESGFFDADEDDSAPEDSYDYDEDFCEDESSCCDEYSDETDIPDEDDLLEMIAEEEAEMAAAGYPVDQRSSADFFEQISDGQFMRYFDLDENGDKLNSNDTQAVGQEIICMDSESGRLSRICGIIRHNQPKPEAAPGEDSPGSSLPVFGQPQNIE